MSTQRELLDLNSATLRSMADAALADAKALQFHNREEAMRLFSFGRSLLTEFYRRKNPAIAHPSAN